MPSITVGLDLGSANDHSALVAVERVYVLPPMISIAEWWRHPDTYAAALVEERHVRHLQRWELSTPYPAVVADVAAAMRTPALRDAWLVLDATGVGRAVRDMFRLEHARSPIGCSFPAPITVTAGRERSGWNVPKQDLVAAVQAPLQLGRLRIAESLALAPVLEKELTGFRLKIGANGRETVDIARQDGQGHGDLVSALMLACCWDNNLRRPDVVEYPIPTQGGNHA